MDLSKMTIIDKNIEYTAAELQRFDDSCAKGRDKYAYDRIELTEEECGRLIDLLDSPDVCGSDLLARPALPYLSAIVRAPKGRVRVTYAPSALPDKRSTAHRVTMEDFPAVDAFVYQYRAHGVPDVVINISRCEISADGQLMTATQHKTLWYNNDSPVAQAIKAQMPSGFVAGTSFPDVLDWERDIKLLYLGIQLALINRPVLFKQRVENDKASATGEPVKAAQRNRKVLAQRVLIIDKDELMRLPRRKDSKGHSFSCPCWGVIGHWRHMKNGKNVWVHPYTKGKERLSEGSYSAKKYQLVKEASQHA